MSLRSTLPLLLAGLVAATACSDSSDGPTGPDPGSTAGPVLEAEPAFTPGTSNTITWSITSAKSSWEYLAQRSATADFAEVAATSSWTSATAFVFEDLAHGQAHHFRVRARNGDGALSPWSAVESSTQDAEPPVVSMAVEDSSQTSLLFDLELAAEDPTSGLATLDLWVAIDEGDPIFHGPVTMGEIMFQTDRGGRHDFYLAAVDVAGNRLEPSATPLATTTVPEPIIITDRKGEDFDITNAVLRHGIHQNAWEHGIGRDTIRPVIDPVMIGPGHVNYPDEDSVFEVCTVAFEGDNRAYGIEDMNSREVVDDTVNGVPIAVCY